MTDMRIDALKRKMGAEYEENSILTIDDVASLLGFSTSKVYQMVRNREIPCFKISRSWRFMKEDIYKWLDTMPSLVKEMPSCHDEKWNECVKRIVEDKQIDAEYHMQRHAASKRKSMEAVRDGAEAKEKADRMKKTEENEGKTVFDLLKETGLFFGASDDELHEFLVANMPEKRFFRKGEAVMLESQELRHLYVTESGCLAALLDISDPAAPAKKYFRRAETIGLDVMMSVFKTSYMDVWAEEDTYVILFEAEKMMKYMYSRPPAFLLFSTNVMRLLSDENIRWLKQTQLLMERSTRDKILYYLRLEERKSSGDKITLTDTRREIASHLGINRTALSRELVKMKDDGLIDYKRNTFIILDNARRIYKILDDAPEDGSAEHGVGMKNAQGENVSMHIKDVDRKFETLEEKEARMEKQKSRMEQHIKRPENKKRGRPRSRSSKKGGVV